jgi:hypothetical protein
MGVAFAALVLFVNVQFGTMGVTLTVAISFVLFAYENSMDAILGCDGGQCMH